MLVKGSFLSFYVTEEFTFISHQVELEEIEARDEEFPITRGFLELMNAITDNSIPAGLGSGYRVPGFAPYLEFLRDNILLKFNTRAYRNPAEKVSFKIFVLQLVYPFRWMNFE